LADIKKSVNDEFLAIILLHLSPPKFESIKSELQATKKTQNVLSSEVKIRLLQVTGRADEKKENLY